MAQADKSNITSPSRRAVMAGAAMLPALALPALAASTADAKLIALGRRYEKLLLKYIDATLQWAPLSRAARDEISETSDARQAAIDHVRADLAEPYPFDLIQAEHRRLDSALKRNGGSTAAKRMAALFEDMEPLAEAIKDAPAFSLGGLRAKALVMLYEAGPDWARHDGCLNFPDDVGASRSLFDAAAELTGLTPMVREIERRLAADATEEIAA
jgi:hypothetical protein